MSIHPSETSSGEFLHSIYNEGDDLAIFSPGASTLVHVYYSPEAEHIRPRLPSLTAKRTVLWEEIDALVEFLENRVRPEQDIYLLSEREKVSWEHLFGPEEANSKFLELESRLAVHSQFYDNNFVKMYAR